MDSALKWEIIEPSVEFVADLARFNTEMAWETEKKKLVQETITAGVKSLIEQPKYGSYLTAIVNNKAIGSLLLTYEYNTQLSSQIYWIQSVYVEPEYRGKGTFKSLYNKAIEEAKKHHSYSVKLYVEKENERAKEVYTKLGMSNNNQEVFEMDFSFGDFKFTLPESISTHSFQASKLSQPLLDELSKVNTKHLLGTSSSDNLNIEALANTLKPDVAGDVVVIKEEGEIVGLVAVFPEWSDWRNKVTQWVYDIKISAKIDQSDYQKYVKVFLKAAYDELSKEPMGAFRVNFKDSNDKIKQALTEVGFEESHYYIYEIKTA